MRGLFKFVFVDANIKKKINKKINLVWKYNLNISNNMSFIKFLQEKEKRINLIIIK